MPPPHTADYSLYLVTGRSLLPAGVDYYDSLEQTLRTRKVTLVQIREKDVGRDEFLDVAKRSLAICDRYSVPMLINDDISIALSLPSHVGLHIGQDDLPLAEARRQLGPGRLLGISVHTPAQARQALHEGVADYAGVGPVYGTKSKAGITQDDVLGPRRAASVVAALSDPATGKRMPCVLIGGINAQTCVRSLTGAASSRNHPDGVAVISAIVARRDPDVAAQELGAIIQRFKARVEPGRLSCSHWGQVTATASATASPAITDATLVSSAADLLTQHRSSSAQGPPLVQTITSYVSATMSANIALAFSSSPIMSYQASEAADLSHAVGAAVLNIGTIGLEAREGMRAVGRAANAKARPVVLDPVGVGASGMRQEVVQEILDHTQVTLLKGNAAEISTIAARLGPADASDEDDYTGDGAYTAQDSIESRGVDSGSGTLRDAPGLVRALSRREKCLVLLTGKVDYLSDGDVVLACDNGHALAGQITGSGCALGVMLAGGLAAAQRCASTTLPAPASLSTLAVDAPHRQLLTGALMGLLAMTIASEVAAEQPHVRGPGTFIPAFIDAIAAMDADTIKSRAKVRVV